jgi:4'-phosphopantetheinyl transferase EntD
VRSELEATLRSLAADGVITGARPIREADVGLLLAPEAAAIERAVPKRRREFASGRVLLRSLIGTTAPITVGPDRAPVFPRGVSGSLAHDDRDAIAAITHLDGVTLGVDIEPSTPLTATESELVLRPDEKNVDAHLAFTLKEAAYKAWSSGHGRMLDHHDIRVFLGCGTFTATIVDDGVEIDGRYARTGDRWVALAVTRPDWWTRARRG